MGCGHREQGKNCDPRFLCHQTLLENERIGAEGTLVFRYISQGGSEPLRWETRNRVIETYPYGCIFRVKGNSGWIRMTS